MELLVLRSRNRYIRFSGDAIEYTGLSKASVYPISEKNAVLEKYFMLKEKDEELAVRKLVVLEMDYSE